MKSAARIVLPLALACGLSVAAPAASPEQTFRRGTEAYERGRWDEAVRAWEAVRESGVRDGRVEFNLGNAYYRMGRIGLAILQYERALRLDPADPDVRANLATARSRTRDRVAAPETAGFVRLLHELQDRVGPATQMSVFIVLVWALCGVVAWCASRPGGFTPVAGWTLAVLCVATLATGASWRQSVTRVAGSPRAVVLEDAVEVLSGPGAENAALVTVHEGLTLPVRSVRQEWVQVSLPNGYQGWVPRDALGFV